LGVALTLVLMASLTVGLATAPAGAADPSSNLKWAKLSLPQVEQWSDGTSHVAGADNFVDSEGDFWCAPGTDVGPIAMSPDGKVLFAAVAEDDYFTYWGANWYEVLKSTDGGYSWTVTGFFEDGWNDYDGSGGVDGSSLVDIVVSPDYNEDSTVAVATKFTVYQSIDGGKNFVCMDDDPEWWTNGERIRDLDVSLDTRGRLAYMVGTYDWSGGGDAYVFSTETGLQWQAQDVGYDVMACAFVPPFEDTEGLCVVATDYSPHETFVRFSFGNTQDGGGWGTDIMDAPITDAEGETLSTWWADIGFPDDFDPWGIGNNLLWVGIYVNGYENPDPPFSDVRGDVYRITCKESGTSSATDLDVRGVLTTLLPTETDIISIDVCGDAEAATILVGTDACDLGLTPEQFLVYVSNDSGKNWTPAANGPTGGFLMTTAPDGSGLEYQDAWTHVLMGTDFCNTGLGYVSTIGDYTSAFNRTSDGGESFNQISIIDYAGGGAYFVTDYGFLPWGYTVDGTFYMITSDAPAFPGSSSGAVWQRTNGEHLERVFSYATPGVTQGLFQLAAPMDGSAIFAVDLDFFAAGNDCMWRTTDGGATWPKKITTKPGLTWVSALSATTLYTSHAAAAANNSGIWWSTKSGVGWTKPDESEIPNAAVVVTVTAADENLITCSTYDGQVFISSDGGETVEKVGKNDPASPGPLLETIDLGFADNGFMYATTATVTDVGIWRTSVDLDSPGSCSWERIDDNQESDGAVYYDPYTVTPAGPAIALPISDVLYVIDGTPVDTDMVPPTDLAGGLWRSTNPTGDLDSIEPPYFEKENKGLSNGDALGLLSLDLAMPSFAPTFFCVNYTSQTVADYWEQIVMFTDTLNVGVPLAMPEADETGVGLLPEGYVYPEVTIAWQEMTGATSYQYEIGIDPDFKTVIPQGCGFTNSLAVGAIQLNPNQTYYWHVRVAAEGSLIGAPLISPWSETWKFKTAIGASMARPDLQAPWPGEPDVPLSPTFEWSVLSGPRFTSMSSPLTRRPLPALTSLSLWWL